MRTLRIHLFLLAVLWLTAGCMSTRLVANYDSDNIVSHEATRVTLLWGILQPKDIPAECESKSVCKLSARTNIGYVLVAAVTLGAVVPQKVTWDCCPSTVPEGDLN
jgi:hypothetical protein